MSTLTTEQVAEHLRSEDNRTKLADYGVRAFIPRPRVRISDKGNLSIGDNINGKARNIQLQRWKDLPDEVLSNTFGRNVRPYPSTVKVGSNTLTITTSLRINDEEKKIVNDFLKGEATREATPPKPKPTPTEKPKVDVELMKKAEILREANPTAYPTIQDAIDALTKA